MAFWRGSLQVQSEEGSGSGSLTKDALRAQVRAFLEAEEYDPKLADELFAGTVERGGRARISSGKAPLSSKYSHCVNTSQDDTCTRQLPTHPRAGDAAGRVRNVLTLSHGVRIGPT